MTIKEFKKMVASAAAERKKKAEELKKFKTFCKGLGLAEKGCEFLSAALMTEVEKQKQA